MTRRPIGAVAGTARARPLVVVGDLVGVAGVAVGSLLLSTTLGRGSVLATVVGAPLVLLLPGYVATVSLFPRRRDAAGNEATDRPFGQRGLTTGERIAFSLVGSLVIVACLVRALLMLPVAFSTVGVHLAVCGTVLLGTAVATVQRYRTPAHDRYLPVRSLVERWRGRRVRSVDALGPLDLVLALAVVFASASVVYAATDDRDGSSFTEFAVTPPDGPAVSDDGAYPRTFVRGETRTLELAITNHEGHAETYTVIALLQRVEDGAGVVAERELRRYETRVADGRTHRRNHSIRPTLTGDRLRLTYLLYEGDPPSDPTRATADQSLHLWITVQPPNTTVSTATIPNETDGLRNTTQR